MLFEISPRRPLLNIAVINGGRSTTKLNATNCLITEDPSLMFSIVKVARDQTQPGSLLARLNGLLDERHWERGCYWYGNCSFILSESRVEFGPRYSVVLNRRITHFKKLNVS